MSTPRARHPVLLLAALAPAWACSSGGGSLAGASGDAGGEARDATAPIDAGAPRVPDAAAATPDSGTSSAGDAGRDGGVHADAAASNCPPSWTPTPSCGGGTGALTAPPDFGPNVLIFDATMSMSSIQSQIAAIYKKMDADQFDNQGTALFFKPGAYSLDVQVGFYTHVLGLGRSPDDVTITGAVRAKADWLGSNNATCNFWRTAENLAVVPTTAIDNSVNVWAVSQGTALRRVHIRGNLALDDKGGWSSGGFIGDSKIDTQISSGSQQQFLTRNVDLTNWQGANWNMVFVGDTNAPSGTWPKPPYTVVPQTPVVREKPFLFLDSVGNYAVMVPSLKTSSKGSSFGADPAGNPAPPGRPISIDEFYIAKPASDTAATLNAALASGKHLLLTPGAYKLDSPIIVAQPNTIVLGIGLPVLTPTNGNAALSVGDVDGVTVAGLLLEAASTVSMTLLQVGGSGPLADHSANPTVVLDVNCRIGGFIAGTANACFTINSNNVILENSWLWRADHGAGAGWDSNKSQHGIIVNGNDVTAYALFSEHHQEFQTLWNGNGGAVYFYQSEMPYDPPNQAAWMESAGVNGYPSYKVGAGVTSHHGAGIGVYSFFNTAVYSDNAIETPSGAGIVMTHMMTYGSGTGGIKNIINGTGGAATAYSAN